MMFSCLFRSPVQHMAFTVYCSAFDHRLPAGLLAAVLLAFDCTRADWPTYHGDYALRGEGRLAVPSAPRLAWRYDAKRPIKFSPVAGGGRIYAVASDAEVFALDLAGREVWRRTLGSPEARRSASIAAAPLYYRGRLVVTKVSGDLIAMDAVTGEERWRASLGGPIGAAPNWIAAEDRVDGLVIAVIQSRGIVVALDGANGREVWRAEALERCDSPPSCDNGLIVIGSCQAALHVLDARNGAERFRARLGDDSQVAGGVALNRGVAFTGSRSGSLIAVDLATGNVLWRTDPGNAEIFSTPAIAGDLVLSASEDGTVSAVERLTGALHWSRKLSADSANVVAGGENAIVVTAGRLIILNTANGEERSSVKVSDHITGPALTGGLILVGTDEGHLVAYESGPGTSRQPPALETEVP